MTYQRRRSGLSFTLYPIKEVEDSRGNTHKTVDKDRPIEGKAWTYPQRSAKAEVPGQQHINVTRIGVSVDLAGFDAGELFDDAIDLWAEVDFLGKSWDVVTPPAYHHGTRHTRHWSIDLRERP